LRANRSSAPHETVEKNVDQIEQDLARFKQPVMAVAGGIAAALVIATLPHVYLENIVGATGLSEIVPAAAPPLGNTARGLIALMAGMISASALYLILNHKTKPHQGGSDMGLAIRKNLTSESIEQGREGKARFAVPKLNLSAKSLTKFLKKPKKSPGQVTELKDLPDIRAADRHPDAPARQPIFASSDLGLPLAEKIKRFDQPPGEKETTEPAQPEVQFAEAAEPVVAEAEPQSPFQERAAESPADNAEPPFETVGSKADLSTLSLAELADRLEAGLARLEALRGHQRVAPMPAKPPAPNPENITPVPVTPSAAAPVAIPPLRSVDAVETDSPQARQADMDAALKAALGTLEKMTVQR
tara:strand:+ start:27 stop:1100 length:1074 start_codon:yes stop_codon:yes gene_type:complete